MNTASKKRVQNEYFELSFINFGCKSARIRNFGYFFSKRQHFSISLAPIFWFMSLQYNYWIEVSIFVHHLRARSTASERFDQMNERVGENLVYTYT